MSRKQIHESKFEALKAFKKKTREYWSTHDPYIEIESKLCLHCKDTKISKEFYKCSTNKDGLQPWCISCYKKRHRLNPARQMITNSKARAKRMGLEFNITEEDILIPEICPILKKPMKINDKLSRKEYSPSLDRFDNNKGYTKGNIRVISHRANSLKSDATIFELEQIVKYMKGEI